MLPHFSQSWHLTRLLGVKKWGRRMASALWQLVYQERRRVAFVSVLAFMAGWLFYARLSVELGLPNLAMVSGAVYALIIAPVALLVCAFAPGFRFMIDSIAVSRFVIALAGFVIPEIGTVLVENPLLTALLVVSTGAILSPALHGKIVKNPDHTWRDRYGPRAALARHRVRIEGNLRQHRFTGWLEGKAPIPVIA